MIKKVIKMPIPEEISDKGGASVRFVDQMTIPLDTTIREAIEGLFVLGQEALVKSNFFGLFKSMAAGVSRDAKPRKLSDFLIVMPVVKGPIDLDKGFDPEVNEIRIVARLLNEMELDITNWVFEDVTPGKISFVIESIASARKMGEVHARSGVAINGRHFPNEIEVEYTVEGGKTIKIDGDYIKHDVSRIDIEADGLKGLYAAANDGKLATFKVRGAFSNASKSAMIVYDPFPMTEGVKVKVKVGGEGEDTVGVYGGALAEGSAKAKIDWGDGYVEEVTSLSQLSHKYELPGEYTLRISDDVSEIAFSSPITSSPFASEYAKRILEVEGVGEKLKTLRASALSNAANLVNAKFASVNNVLTDVLKGANAIHYIHFAAANETALKASAGYQADSRLGSTSARVKFDM